MENQWIIHGHKLKQPIADVITGWKVEGWYKDDAYTDAWIFDVDTVNDNVTLYGKFAKIPLESFSLNKTSITPLKIDLTSDMSLLKEWLS